MSAAERQSVSAACLADFCADVLAQGGRRHIVYHDMRAARVEVKPGDRDGTFSVLVVYQQEK